MEIGIRSTRYDCWFAVNAVCARGARGATRPCIFPFRTFLLGPAELYPNSHFEDVRAEDRTRPKALTKPVGRLALLPRLSALSRTLSCAVRSTTGRARIQVCLKPGFLKPLGSALKNQHL